MERPEKAIEALAHYSQADEDGVMVLASRQAIDEVLAYLRAPQSPEPAGDVVERVLDALDAACLNDDGKRVSWLGYTRDDRLSVIRAALKAAMTQDDKGAGEFDHLQELVEAARAVVRRWDEPSWKDVPATAGYIHRLRNALDAYGPSTPPASPATLGE